jgi:hypothetical protein
LAKEATGVFQGLLLNSRAEADPNGFFLYRLFRTLHPFVLVLFHWRRSEGMRSVFEWRYVSSARLPIIYVGNPPSHSALRFKDYLLSGHHKEKDESVITSSKEAFRKQADELTAICSDGIERYDSHAPGHRVSLVPSLCVPVLFLFL